MAANIPDYVPWHIYERDIKRLSDDIERLVGKIDGLVDTIGELALSQHRDDVMEEHRKEDAQRKWGFWLAMFAATLSCASALIVAFVTSGMAG